MAVDPRVKKKNKLSRILEVFLMNGLKYADIIFARSLIEKEDNLKNEYDLKVKTTLKLKTTSKIMAIIETMRT